MQRGRARFTSCSWRFVGILFWLLIGTGGAAASDSPDVGLLDPATLKAEQSRWIVLDARPRAQWLAGHLPGALSFSWEDYTRTDAQGIPYRIWPPETLAAALGSLGIDERSPVVFYGDADSSWGGEGWGVWALAWLGHRGPLRILNGGIQAWQGLGLPLEKGEVAAGKEGRYQARPRPELITSAATLQQAIDAGAVQVVDTRSTLEWLGGRIKGAVHIPWKDLFSGPENRPLSPDSYRELMRRNGLDLRRPVVFYCTGGIRSGYACIVHQLSGLPPAVNFEGGTEEWDRRQRR